MGCCFTVHQASAAIVERWGRFARFAGPGFQCKIPCAEDVVAFMDLRVQQISVRVETKSHDNVFMHVDAAVQYQINPDQIYEAMYKIATPVDMIRAHVLNVVRAFVPSLSLDDVFLQKDKIANAVKDELKKEMHSSGYQIVAVLITDINPAEEVKRAMNEINTQERLRVAAVSKAEAAKITEIKAAEGDAESKRLSGVGLANQRRAIVEGLAASVRDFADSVPGSDTSTVMELLMMNQHFDCLEKIASGKGSRAVFVPYTPNSVQDLKRQITEGLMVADAFKDDKSSVAVGQGLRKDTRA
eukprot:TRINITY_DN10596_c0_g1_i1.p1 TRINITY_DN10596_c0_g1~~TRINITY_DN10596_c0_g1_i1.p1  ORF type:complete len:300 (-),score=108.01 TRINITY_DN10596_c0_g1_i1:217-1116(-)